jgi:hypothetical protein
MSYPLFTKNIGIKNPKKDKKPKKKQKNPLGWVSLKNPGFFQPCLVHRHNVAAQALQARRHRLGNLSHWGEEKKDKSQNQCWGSAPLTNGSGFNSGSDSFLQ